ncbi:MAG: DUF1292 domain-containing protein [Clostridia bacterium]|nr:DUF1292 domain-containing protein [Clostridia bacterium]
MTDDKALRLTDDDGQEADFRQLCRFDLRGKTYVVLEDLEDEDSVIIFSVETDEEGEEVLCAVEDEDESEEAFYFFQAEMDDYDFGPAV